MCVRTWARASYLAMFSWLAAPSTSPRAVVMSFSVACNRFERVRTYPELLFRQFYILILESH